MIIYDFRIFSYKFQGTGKPQILIHGIILFPRIKSIHTIEKEQEFIFNPLISSSFLVCFFFNFFLLRCRQKIKHQQLLGLTMTQTPSKREVPAKKYSAKEKGTGIPSN